MVRDSVRRTQKHLAILALLASQSYFSKLYNVPVNPYSEGQRIFTDHFVIYSCKAKFMGLGNCSSRERDIKSLALKVISTRKILCCSFLG